MEELADMLRQDHDVLLHVKKIVMMKLVCSNHYEWASGFLAEAFDTFVVKIKGKEHTLVFKKDAYKA